MMADQLTQTFAALAHPARRAMLARLVGGQISVTELAAPFLKRMSLPAVIKHVKVLEKAGLIIKTHDAQRRPCELNAAALKDAARWMEQYRVHWEESFDRLDEYLKTVTAHPEVKTTKKKAKGTRHGRQAPSQ
jgi:DNA-binding transcriptional ArsR family regulator